MPFVVPTKQNKLTNRDGTLMSKPGVSLIKLAFDLQSLVQMGITPNESVNKCYYVRNKLY